MILKFAEANQLKLLVRVCEQTFIENFEELCSPDLISNISLNSFEQILQSDFLQVTSEASVFQAIVNWMETSRSTLKASDTEKSRCFDRLYNCVRLIAVELFHLF